MRAAIFIDGGYYLKQLQDCKTTVDYAKLADYLLAPLRATAQIDIMRCYFYYCPPWTSTPPTEDEQRRMATHEKFLEELSAISRWQFREGKLEKRRDGDRDVYSQKRVDVKLSVDLVRHAAAGHIQHAILVAGDSDFIPAIKAAQEEGVTITLCCGNDRSAHRDLVKLVDEVRWVNWREAPSQPVQKTKEQPKPQPKPQPKAEPKPVKKKATKKRVQKKQTRRPRRKKQ